MDTELLIFLVGGALAEILVVGDLHCWCFLELDGLCVEIIPSPLQDHLLKGGIDVLFGIVYVCDVFHKHFDRSPLIS